MVLYPDYDTALATMPDRRVLRMRYAHLPLARDLVRAHAMHQHRREMLNRIPLFPQGVPLFALLIERDAPVQAPLIGR